MNINVSQDIQSLSTFKRDTSRFLKRLKKESSPLVLTVNGRAEVVVLDAPVYEKFLEAREFVETVFGIQKGLRAVENKDFVPAQVFFKSFKRKHNIAKR